MARIHTLEYSRLRTDAAPSQRDFDAARLEILRRRILVFVFVVAGLLMVLSVVAELLLRHATRPFRLMAIDPAVGGLMMIVGASIKLRASRRQRLTLRSLLNRSVIFVVVAVAMQIPASAAVAMAVTQVLQKSGLERAHVGAGLPLLISMLCIHLSAASLLPWSLWDAAKPLAILCAVAAIAAPFAPDPWTDRLGGIFGLVLMSLPGMVICWFRFSRLRERVELKLLSGRYDEVQRELSYARRIHEKLFPPPLHDGPVRFDYRYEPMRQIGGDFVDYVLSPDRSALTIVLIDVTGHGIAAALAVNRLHGEIKRAVARHSSDSTDPRELILALNEYVHLTLADEGVFATAFVARVDAKAKTIEWCNAGHPPAFLIRGNDARAIESLDSTTMMLGPQPPEDFEAICEAGSISIAAGDLLIVYTDGAIECRNESDEELGLPRLRQIIAASINPTAGAAQALDGIVTQVTRFRAGPPDDDMLVLAVALG